jgi:nitrite transporter NirC
MYADTIEYFVRSAERRVAQWHQNSLGFMAGSIAGGAYIGLGILLILNVGSQLPPEYQKLGMGLTFAIALILVTIAGAELSTGYALYMTLGCLAGRVRVSDAGRTMIACWVGNLLGAMLVAGLFALGGANGLLDDPNSILFKIASAKMKAPALTLMAKAILCNWLVCLALWMAARVDSDVAKCVVIFWCLLAFITSGFEHSVANMTVLSLAVMGHAGDLSTIALASYNLLIVSFGNLVGGALLVATSYWVADRGVRGEKSNASQVVNTPLS